MPLEEGKTATGKVEMLQLYQGISVVPEGFARQGTSPVASTALDQLQRHEQVAPTGSHSLYTYPSHRPILGPAPSLVRRSPC